MENGIVKPMIRSLLISYVLSGILLAALAFALYKLHLKEGPEKESGSAGSSGGFCPVCFIL